MSNLVNYRYVATKMQDQGVRSSGHELWQWVKIIIGWYKSFESHLNYQIYSIKLIMLTSASRLDYYRDYQLTVFNNTSSQ